MGEIEVMTPGQSTIDFDMKNGNFSPGFTAHIEEDYYFSAPASPRQISQFYREFDDFLINNSSIINSPDVRRNSVSLTVPFDWEEKPGVPKNKFEDDFAFDVSQEMEIASVSADELFRGGKIRPLVDISTEKKKKKKKNTEERAAAIRGRERSVSSLSASRSGHRVTRSVSPLRVSEYPWEEEFRKHQEQQSSKQSSSKPNLTSSVSALSSSSSLKGHKKWKLKDFFLFRSASEGRATDKSDPLKKYASLFKKQDHDIKCSSFRSIDNNSVNSVLHSSRRKGPAVSPHELHYTMNRAVSEDLKKKTFLPYKQGILGRLSFNPAVHAIANGFGFSRKL